jgi:hypothetical protein
MLMGLIVRAQTESSSHKIIFFDDFNNNENNWTMGHNKHVNAKIDSGFYYLTAEGRAYGSMQQINIDSKKDFEIEARIKISRGNPQHKNYYSMLFWGREDMTSYYFTFAKDGFASVEVCDGKNQSNCIVKSGSLQKTALHPDDFNIYTIRKTGNSYIFLINRVQFYHLPFAPFYGNMMGFGAGRNVSLIIDYLKVSYL